MVSLLWVFAIIYWIAIDEPFNGLDYAGVREIRQILLDLASEGKTILLSSHYSEDIIQLCTTVHKMEADIIYQVR